jgi:hypothetical protein
VTTEPLQIGRVGSSALALALQRCIVLTRERVSTASNASAERVALLQDKAKRLTEEAQDSQRLAAEARGHSEEVSSFLALWAGAVTRGTFSHTCARALR